MATIAKLNVLLDLDDSGFQRKMQNARDRLDSFGASLRSVGTKMTAGVTTPILAAGGAIVGWASDLEQTLGATDQLWGDNAGAMKEWAKSADTSLGMSENSALQNANRFNALFGTLDVGEDTVMGMSQGFVQLSSDLSAMWGGSPDEAANALTQALRGNYEGLDKYGITLTEATVNQEAMNVAMADGRTEITEADKVQARHNLIMEQTTASQGQFAREADTTAGRMAILKAQLKNVATELGAKLLPIVNKGLGYLSKFVDWVEKLSDRQRTWVLIIAAVAAAMGPLLLIIGMLLPGISALIGVVTFLLSPVGLVVLAIAALAAGLIYAYTHFEGFREIVDAVASTIKDVAVAAFEKLVEAFNKLKAAFDAGGFSQMFATLGSMILNGLQQLSDLALQGIQWLADAFLSGVSSASSAAWAWIQGLADGALGKWNEFTAWLGGLAADAAAWIGDTASTLWQKGVDFIVGLGNGITAQWGNLSTWLAGVATLAVSAVGDVASTLWQKGVDLIVGLGEGITAQWANLNTWLVGVAGYVTSAIGDVTSTLWQKGVDLFVGMGNGLVSQWGNLKDWLSGTAGRITSAIGTLTSTLWQKGVDTFVGLGNGLVAQWGNLSAWLSGIGGMIAGAVGDLAGSLYNAGVAVMNGLWDGLKDGWGNITGWLSGLNPADWKGPEQRDKKMLYMPGIWIMEGLQRGLAEGWGDTTRLLSGFEPSLNVSPSNVPSLAGVTSGNYGGAQVVQIITLEPGKWKEFLADAQAGGTFARQFGNELGMMEGRG